MSLLTALYQTYTYALEKDLVGKMDEDGQIILPIYHNSMKSNGKNIVEVTLDDKSQMLEAKILAQGELAIFPVTEDSVARSSGISPHPLFDNFDYIIQDGEKKSLAYLKQMEEWLEYEEIDFVRIVYNFIKQAEVFEKILNKLFLTYEWKDGKKEDKIIRYLNRSGEKEKWEELNFSKVFMTFKIQHQGQDSMVSLSENKDLQEKFINYVHFCDEKQGLPKITCNISGKEDYLCVKHRPLIGSARLISQITANPENYKGRFINPDETIKIGKDSSQKIILMAKSLLDGEKTSRWLGELSYALSWFSDDIKNESKLDIGKSIQVKRPQSPGEALLNKAKEKAKTKENSALKLADKNAEDIVKSFTSGRILFSDTSKYYLAVVDKVSNGRVAVKYFREMDGSRLKENLARWQEKYHWPGYGKEIKEFDYTPNPLKLIQAAYGIEREKGLEVAKKKFVTDQYANILAAIIEGRDMPRNIVRVLEMNVRNRLNYDKTWPTIKSCALVALKNQEGIKDNMLDRQNIDRSYLFGRLLALYERLEATNYEKNFISGKNEEGPDQKKKDTGPYRLTNAEKLWTSFVNKPVTMNLQLRNLMKPYEKKLKLSEDKRGIYKKIKHEISEVTNILQDHYDYQLPETNRPLGPGFIFGYEAQMAEIFKKKESKGQEGEGKND